MCGDELRLMAGSHKACDALPLGLVEKRQHGGAVISSSLSTRIVQMCTMEVLSVIQLLKIDVG
jgi:hypothetical protein